MNSVQKMNIIGNLPVELCQEFFLYLNVNDIFKSATIFNLHETIINNQYFWKLKFKVDKIQPIKLHQKSEKYENYAKQFQCIEQGFYKYNYELRQNWLTKSWNDALKPRGKELDIDYLIRYADEKIFVMVTDGRTYKIRNFTTNKIISKFKTRKHYCRKINVQFPFLISFDDERNEILVWNVEEQKLLWKRGFSKNLDIISLRDIFCTNYNTIAAVTSDETQMSLINISTGIIKANLPHDAEIWESYFCNNFLLIRTHHWGRCLNIWNVDDNTLKYSIDISAMPFVNILNNGDAFAIFRSSNNAGYVLNFNNGIIYEFETKLDNTYDLSMVLQKSHVVYFDLQNNLKVVDYITRRCLYNKKYEVEIIAVTSNNNFIILVTRCDIRILEPETFNELRTFSLKATLDDWKDSNLLFSIRALDSKLILQYDEIEKDYNCWLFTLDFDVSPLNVEGLEKR